MFYYSFHAQNQSLSLWLSTPDKTFHFSVYCIALQTHFVNFFVLNTTTPSLPPFLVFSLAVIICCIRQNFSMFLEVFPSIFLL
jgi:hypothetical protein